MTTVSKDFRVKSGLVIETGSVTTPLTGSTTGIVEVSSTGVLSRTTDTTILTLGSTGITLGATVTNIAGVTINSTTIPSSKTLVVTTDIGTSVQAYSSTLAGITTLGSGTGFLKNTAGTWSYDTNSYVTTTGAAAKVANSLILKADTGTTEGTDLYTFDGSAAKTLNVVAGTGISITKTSGQWSIAATNAGTVTSVGVTAPIENTGTSTAPVIGIATAYGDTKNPYASKTANYVLAAPNGSAGAPTFRAIVAADIPTLNQSTTGNAATATALATPRAINGVNFDGTAAITVTAAAGTLTGTTLNSTVVSSSLTSVGTLSSLTTSGDVTVGGNLTVNGTTTTINSTTITVDDKNIELGSIASPTDTTADGAGITVKGATDKTWNWVNSTSAWTSSENIDLASGKVIKIAGTQVLSATNYTGNAATVTNGVYTTDTGTVTNTMLAGSIANSKLTNSSVTVNGTSISLGTSGTITVPISTGVTGLGTGVATFLATPTSANLASAITDESGSGTLVFSASPALTGTVTFGGNAGIVNGSGSGSALFTISSLFDKTVYNGGEFTVKLSDGTDFEIIRVLVVIKGTTFYVTQYGDVQSNGSLGTIDFTLSTNNVNMTITPVAGTVTAKVVGTLLAA